MSGLIAKHAATFGAALGMIGWLALPVPSAADGSDGSDGSDAADVAGVVNPEPARTVSFETEDGITLHGDLYLASESMAGPLVLLFHQAGSDARGEYGPLVGRLLEHGYHAFAIDQRVGGSRLGGVNRTIGALEGREFGYCDAYPDLVAALYWVKDEGFTGPCAAWGSSYSAALVFRLAYDHPDEVDAILAFSPASGPPMEGCNPETWAAKLPVPGLALRPAREMEIDSVREQLERLETIGLKTHVADPGVHGSSMLNAQRIEGDPSDAWRVVLGFLADVLVTDPQ